MKTSVTKILSFGVALAFLFGVLSCAPTRHHRGSAGYGYKNHVPPGQAKKHYGSKSAKHYAPGQQKKYRRGKR